MWRLSACLKLSEVLMNTYYVGDCGAEILLEERGRMFYANCDHGRGLQCEDEFDPLEICDGCSLAEKRNTESGYMYVF